MDENLTKIIQISSVIQDSTIGISALDSDGNVWLWDSYDGVNNKNWTRLPSPFEQAEEGEP